jgi:heptosyltransferase I
MKKEIQKVLIVRLSALGDIVNSAVVVQFIKELYPDITLEWICEETYAPLLKECSGIDNVHTINLKAIKKTKSLSLLKTTLKKLRSLGEYDLIIDMQGLIKSALVARVIGKKTHGFNKNSSRESLSALFYKQASTISYEEGVVKRNATVISDALHFTITEAMILHKHPIFKTHDRPLVSHEQKNVAFVIGASWDSKIYPAELVLEVCKNINASCHIIWGSPSEFERASWIASQTPNATLAPELSLEELISFISQMDLLIGNDTGPTHIAWAQNIPSITLFGPTTERMIQQTPINIALKSPSDVNIFKINKNDFSIQEIAPQEIIARAKELIDGI